VRLSTRFALCLVVSVPLLVSVAGLLVLGLVSADMRAERDRQLSARLRALTPAAGSYAWRTRVLPDLPATWLQQRLIDAATGVNSSGGVYVEVDGAEPLAVGDVPARPPAAGRTGTIEPADFDEGGRRWRYVTTHLGRRGDVGARLWLFDPEERLSVQIGMLTERLVQVTVAAAAVGAVSGLLLGRFAVRPLARLGGQVRAIGTRVPTPARLETTSRVTEIDELARLLNDLLDRRDAAVARTGEALETARAFAATAAHELRTPLTSMGTNVSLLGHPALDPAERAEIIADLGAEHGRVQRLITLLRQLSRGELLDPATFGETDLSEIAGEAVEQARRRHPRATVSAALAADVRVRGWDEGLRLIVDNLLDNAAIHGVDDQGRARVTVTLTADEPDAVLTVEDAGPGIPPGERDAVFTRFHRRAGSPGSGLGLTLVHQQAVLHGGHVTVSAGAGTRVEVRLPRDHALKPPAGTRSWLE
jgi:two-component system sensor histidine kinase PrrB